ncbi:MAG: hypothetical protein JO308_04900 [Verrucomicrobia bacterium]|nr:hypothetical protein [Verrucomicrobiota bacterium]
MKTLTVAHWGDPFSLILASARPDHRVKRPSNRNVVVSFFAGCRWDF